MYQLLKKCAPVIALLMGLRGLYNLYEEYSYNGLSFLIIFGVMLAVGLLFCAYGLVFGINKDTKIYNYIVIVVGLFSIYCFFAEFYRLIFQYNEFGLRRFIGYSLMLWIVMLTVEKNKSA